MYKITYKKDSLKTLRKMPANIAKSFRDNFEKLAEDIERTDLDIKSLAGSPYHRLKIGDYRGIYQCDNGELIITVFTIKPRGDVYKWLHK